LKSSLEIYFQEESCVCHQRNYNSYLSLDSRDINENAQNISIIELSFNYRMLDVHTRCRLSYKTSG